MIIYPLLLNNPTQPPLSTPPLSTTSLSIPLSTPPPISQSPLSPLSTPSLIPLSHPSPPPILQQEPEFILADIINTLQSGRQLPLHVLGPTTATPLEVTHPEDAEVVRAALVGQQ